MKIWKVRQQSSNVRQGRSQRKIVSRECPWLNSLTKYHVALFYFPPSKKDHLPYPPPKESEKMTEASASACLTLATALTHEHVVCHDWLK